jgi:Rrf2 family iron-sulfur cluster assembly transcriptional regulator
MKEGTENV